MKTRELHIIFAALVALSLVLFFIEFENPDKWLLRNLFLHVGIYNKYSHDYLLVFFNIIFPIYQVSVGIIFFVYRKQLRTAGVIYGVGILNVIVLILVLLFEMVTISMDSSLSHWYGR